MPLTVRPSWRDIVNTHRLEYPFPLYYVVPSLCGASYAVGTPAQLLAIPAVTMVVANFVLMVSTNVLNNIHDVAADATNSGKRHLGDSSARIGTARMTRWVVAEMVVAQVLATIVSLVLDRPMVALAIAASLGAQVLYNLEPVRLKRRGWAGPISLAFTFSFIPCVTTFHAIKPGFPTPVLLVFLGVSVLLVARALWWTLPDHAADVASGERTPVVAFGRRALLVRACIVTGLGVALLGWGLWWRYGVVWALTAMTASSMFLVEKLRLMHGLAKGREPDERRMRTHSLTVVAAAEFLIALIPFLNLKN